MTGTGETSTFLFAHIECTQNQFSVEIELLFAIESIKVQWRSTQKIHRIE